MNNANNYSKESSKLALPGKAVLVTGCSSGIGQAIALQLSRQGCLVFATVRNPQAGDDLAHLAGPDLVPVAPVDLTRSAEISGAVEVVTRELQARNIDGLYAIVNNAGGGSTAPLELLDLDILERELQIRVVGPARLVQGLLPEMRKAKGRLLWITTPGLIPLAYKSSVHVAEFAAQGLARTFKIELAAWQIPSILIACGGVRSQAVSRMDQQLAQSLQTWRPDQLALYEAELKEVQDRSAQLIEKGVAAERVAEVVSRALCARKPKPIYRVGYAAGLFAFLGLLPGTWVDRLFTLRAG